MKKLRNQLIVVAALLGVLAASPAAAQCDANGREGQISDVFTGTTALEWRMLVEHRAVTLTVSAPCGLIIDRTYKEGESPFFSLKEIPADDPDGRYHWQLRIDPYVDPSVEKELAGAHANGDDGRDLEYQFRQKGLLPAGPFRQSGSFDVVRGSIVPPDQQEEGANDKSTVGVKAASTAGSAADCPAAPAVETARLSTILPAVDRGGSTRPQVAAAAAEGQRRAVGEDVVYNDDLIIIGSECVGFDCVNGEVFSFDTIRLKENNLRIHFEDTSTASGFPTNDWRIIANDSASGGASKFSIEDSTGARTPFTIRAGASANAIFVDSTGRVGFRTSTPILDLHVNSSNTPAMRLEQNSSGGFSAQVWDVAGNEANFFVRDVTGGSRLPFRIRPGAPTSSIDISNDGDVGIGTASPDAKLEVESGVATAASVRYTNTNASGFAGGEYFEGTTQGLFVGLDNANNVARINAVNSYPLVILTNSTERIRFPAPGGNFITATNGASLTAGGIWADASSRDLKDGIVELDAVEALSAFASLAPVKFQYKAEPGEQYVGFIAEEVPELVARNDQKSLAPMDIVAVLTKVVQEQQKTIDELSVRLTELEKDEK